MKRLVALAGLLLVLSGCTQKNRSGPDNYVAEVVELPDGRSVICVSWKRNYAGGLSCDWDNAGRQR